MGVHEDTAGIPKSTTRILEIVDGVFENATGVLQKY